MTRFYDQRSSRAVVGRANKAAGDAFEAWLELQHREAKRSGLLACVEKSEPHSKVVGGRVIYSRPGVADYFGTLGRGVRAISPFVRLGLTLSVDGVSFAAEAKSTSGDRLARAEVKPKQAGHLDAVSQAGGLALLLCEFRSVVPVRFAVLWDRVPWRKLRTVDSVSAEELAGWCINPGENYLAGFVRRS